MRTITFVVCTVTTLTAACVDDAAAVDAAACTPLADAAPYPDAVPFDPLCTGQKSASRRPASRWSFCAAAGARPCASPTCASTDRRYQRGYQ
jgi:hypothetical protein